MGVFDKTRLNSFSGWLMTYYANLIMGIVICLYSLKVAMFLEFPLFLKVIIGITKVLYIALIIIILSNVKKQEKQVPDRIVALMMGVYIVQVAMTFLELVIAHYVSGIDIFAEAPRLNGIITGQTLWYIVWTGYFKHSKRVLEYYGAKAKCFSKNGLL